MTVGTSSHPYVVHIGEGIAGRLSALLNDAKLTTGRFIVSSPPVWRWHGSKVSQALPGARSILIPDGERFKHVKTVSRIYDALARAEADRSTMVVAFGGGVVGDVAGFAAATYLRGLRFVQVPTTLLAQVDSAIGGKVGVNHTRGKNLIGAFYPPSLVVVDPLLLRTLPHREFRAGLYEVVKYSVIGSRTLFDSLDRDMQTILARESLTLVPVIAECCRLKAAVVESDEKEAGPRRVLNFGHTIGHALEAITSYLRFRHGEAVAYGMTAAAEIAAARGTLADGERRAIVELIAKMGPLPPVGDLSARQALKAIKLDKKVIAGTLHFVLPSKIGATTIVNNVAEDEIKRALKKIGLKA